MKILLNHLLVIGLLSSCSNTNPKTEKDAEVFQLAAPLEDGTRIIGEQSTADTLKGSLPAKANGRIGDVGITINYYSPAVRGRIIWGGLVPFDKVWVTGAHSATSIEFDSEVIIGGVTVAPGKYALFTIPGKEQWTFIINKNWEQHLTDDYDQKDDVVRVSVEPEVEDSHQERLRYVVETEGSKDSEIVVYWDKLEVSLPITAKN